MLRSQHDLSRTGEANCRSNPTLKVTRVNAYPNTRLSIHHSRKPDFDLKVESLVEIGVNLGKGKVDTVADHRTTYYHICGPST